MNIDKKIAELYGGEIAGRDESAIELYWSWYRGFYEKFHNYRMYNGENFIYLTKKSLQMAKKVSETWADLLINEKCDVRMDDKAKKDLDKIFKKTKFWSKANKAVELGFALSYSALVGEITPSRELKIVLVNAKGIVPLRIENDDIVDCAFYKELEKFVRITMWVKKTGGYMVTTVDFDKRGREIPDTRVEFQTSIEIPLFMIIKPNIVSNSTDENYNYGISVYANAIDTLKAIDTKYDGFDFEFIGGRKKVYVSMDAMKVVMAQDGSSIQAKPFDPLDSTYYNTGDTGQDGKPMVQEGGGELRSAQYIEALNFELGMLSEKVGLGYGYFKFDPKGMVTATQVISENSDLFRTLKKHEILIRDEFIQFVKAICEYSNAYCKLKVASYKPDEIEILFDDSIIEDKDAQKKNDQVELEKGLMTHVEYAIKWDAMEEKDAKAKYQYLDIVKKANALMPLLEAKLITPEYAVDLIYGDGSVVFDKAKILEYLEKDDLNLEDGEFKEDEPEGGTPKGKPIDDNEPDDDEIDE